MTNSTGAIIKYLRTVNQLSQEELGRRIGVQRAAINKYENGSVTNIPIATVEQIAQVFDVSPSYILGWDDIDDGKLATEVRVIRGVGYFYGKDAVDIIETYSHLNTIGKKRLHQYCCEMGELYHD